MMYWFSSQSALEGSLNVLRQAVKYKVKKFVMTAMWASTLERKYLSRSLRFRII